MDNRREVVKTIVGRKTCPDRMGLYEHYWQDTQQSWEEHDGLPAGIDLTAHFDYDLREIEGSWFRSESLVDQEEVLEETDETRVVRNGWGATTRAWKNKAGTPEHLAFELTSEDIWRKKYREPLLSLDTRRFGDLDKLRKNYTDAMAEDRFAMYNNVTIFEQMRASIGDVAMLEAMYLNPDWIRDYCDVMTNHTIMHLEYLFREVGVPDGVWMYEDMGYTQAPFISPDLQRDLILPFHKRLGDFIHSYNIPWIMHSCGKIRPFLPAIREAGVDCLQVLEAKAGQDVREFAGAVDNSMAFMGNLNILAFETNDFSRLADEIVPKLKDISQKKIPFVFHSDHSIPKTVRLDTYRHALDLYHEHGRY
ncbi:MAG: hypothetical protein GF418_03665 [Chitinivibrionales bacterium]|nr:hypothetical protein [Chitinivibrionales bacterium]MBD3394702.1 hypothetical protein [Chitinivibrionales bacterium]